MNLYVNPRKSLSSWMIEAFASGLKECGVAHQIIRDCEYRKGPAVFYGVQEELIGVFQQCRRKGDDWYLIDNGYFASKWKGGSFYRITHNDWQVSGDGESDGRRWADLGIEIKPWRVPDPDARPLIALQSAWWYELRNTTLYVWRDAVVDKMRSAGWPEPVSRGKHEHKTPIDWQKVSAVVTHSSNVAVDGLIEGVRPVCTAHCAGGLAGAKIEQWPNLPKIADRQKWASVLADNQWNVAEIRSGLAWRMLTR